MHAERREAQDMPQLMHCGRGQQRRQGRHIEKIHRRRDCGNGTRLYIEHTFILIM